jgi:hypothetical protein
MATIIKRVHFWKPDDDREKVKRKGGYFLKWTKFSRTERNAEMTITTEIEMAVVVDASTGQTYAIKSEDFVVDLPDFISTNKIEAWNAKKK